MSVTEFVFEIRPLGRAWTLAPQGEPQTLCFDTFEAAERRARFLAIRQDVRGLASVIHILDSAGELVGVWRGERYGPAKPVETLRHAA